MPLSDSSGREKLRRAALWLSPHTPHSTPHAWLAWGVIAVVAWGFGADQALSPTADANGQRTLAVAGFGVQSTRGEIGLFRFPGSNNLPTGDIEAQLPSGSPNEKESSGHTNIVLCLAFDPRGQHLASGSHDR